MHARTCVPACLLTGTLVALALPTSEGARGAAGMAATGMAARPQAALPRDGQHDFDFEFGTWQVRLRRLLNPLSGSSTWVELEGRSTVRRVWDGRANLGELVVGNETTHIEGLSLRLYDPESREWSIHWANSRNGELGPAMIGRFENGRGEFYNQELFEGRAVYVRFIFSDVRPTTFRLEQAFSSDGGRTWEPNWIAAFTRLAS
jgi:hypothetical protein